MEKQENKLKKSGIIAICLVISLLVVGIFAEGQTLSNFVSGDFWSLNGDTIVENNTHWNVNIGENASTTFKLNVKGTTRLRDTLFLQLNKKISFVDNTTAEYGFIKYNRLTDTMELSSGNGAFPININASNFAVEGPTELKDHVTFRKNASFTINNQLQFGHSMYLLKISTQSMGSRAFIEGANILNISANNELNLIFPDTVNVNTETASFTKDVIVDNNVSAKSFEGFGIVPLGGTISWCNHIGNVYLSVPSGYWVCNGSTIVDSDSIFNGQPSPNMTNRFIRGNNFTTIGDGIVDTGYMSGNKTHVNTLLEMYRHAHGITTWSFTSILNGVTPGVQTFITKASPAASVTGYDGSSTRYNIEPQFYDMVVLVRIK